MRAFIVDRCGKSGNVLRAGDMPEPEVREHDVLVQNHAAGVNALDAKIKDGEFKLVLPYRPPFVLGNDVAGVVVRVGAGVRRFQPGDEVYARPDKGRIGTFAELIDAAIITPVLDRIFPFESTNEALAHVQTGRAKGKVVVKVK